MSIYVLRMVNFKTVGTEAIVRSVLNCPTIGRLAFPATMDIWPDKLRLSTPAEFDFKSVAGILYQDSILPRQVSFVFDSDTGIRLVVMVSE